MEIINNNEDKKCCISPYGNYVFVLTQKEIAALLEGKVLGDPNWDEYGTFITMDDNIWPVNDLDIKEDEDD